MVLLTNVICMSPTLSLAVLLSAFVTPAVLPLRAHPDKLPLVFERNVGQLAGPIRYVARADGMVILFEDKQIRFKLPAGEISMEIVGAETAQISDDHSAYAYNLRGSDAERWKRVPLGTRIRYIHAYPGIDLVFYTVGAHIEYDFVVSSTGDPDKIKLRFQGAARPEIAVDGSLALKTSKGMLLHSRPRVYQTLQGGTREVESRYQTDPHGLVKFEIARYDRKAAVIIDPAVSYSTYFGGVASDVISAMATDARGSVYVTGETWSAGLADQQSGVRSSSDSFVAKLDNGGRKLAWIVYLGGNSRDYASSIATDAFGNVYVAGTTLSSDFPRTSGAFFSSSALEDVFIAKFSPDGRIQYAARVGGGGAEYATGVTVNTAGEAYVSGYTTSTDFPVTTSAFQSTLRGATDGFFFKLNSAGSSLIVSTFLGGRDVDLANGICIDSSGSVYVVGGTSSTDIPTRNAIQTVRGGSVDAFIARFDPSGSYLQYATYFGGYGSTSASSVACDSSGVWMSGATTSSNLRTTSDAVQKNNAGGYDAYATELDASGNLLYSTYIGGRGTDAATAIRAANGKVAIGGYTNSADLLVMKATQPMFAGVMDGFLVSLDAFAHSIQFATYYGSVSEDRINAVAFDQSGAAIYFGGYSSYSGLPSVNAAQPSYAGGMDGFLAKLCTAVAHIGVVRNGSWFIDANANFVWDGGDIASGFGIPSDVPLAGSWSGIGGSAMAVYRPADASWFFDWNKDGVWGGGDVYAMFGVPGFLPVVGDWSGDGKVKIGAVNPTGYYWFIDWNGNLIWDDQDIVYQFGSVGEVPVMGDWTGTGAARIGTFDSRTATWKLDWNGNGIWDSGDRTIVFGSPGDIPVVGDWDGSGTAKLGIFSPSTAMWRLDYNGNGISDFGDQIFYFGIPGDIPVVMRW